MTDPDPILADPAVETAPRPVRAVPPRSTRRRPRGVVAGTVTSWAAAALSTLIGCWRLVLTWSGSIGGDTPADSWIYQPGWAIVQVALALLAVGSALLAVTAPGGRRLGPLATAVIAAAVLGWSLDDGAYQLIGWLYYR